MKNLIIGTFLFTIGIVFGVSSVFMQDTIFLYWFRWVVLGVLFISIVNYLRDNLKNEKFN